MSVDHGRRVINDTLRRRRRRSSEDEVSRHLLPGSHGPVLVFGAVIDVAVQLTLGSTGTVSHDLGELFLLRTGKRRPVLNRYVRGLLTKSGVLGAEGGQLLVGCL